MPENFASVVGGWLFRANIVLGIKGSRLFNLLTDPIRNMKGCSVDQFKAALDTFLATVPDQPTTEGTSRAAKCLT